MSASDERASEETSGRPASVSVYDLIYRDAARIALFLSQFDRRGLLTSLKHTEAVADTRAAKNLESVRGGLRVFNAGAGREEQEGEEEKEATERGYDPQWRNALVLLDYLTQHDMISYDLATAELGQFVLVSGALSILDLRVLKSMWDMPAVQSLMAAGAAEAAPRQNRQQQRRDAQKGAGQKRAAADLPQPVAFALEIIKVLPHSLQARLSGQGGEVWCSLEEASLVVSSSDLLLKHGVDIAGHWSMVGILDAKPSEDSVELGAVDVAQPFGGVEEAVSNILMALAPVARTTLGRPSRAYGITPLVILREVRGQ